MRFYKEMISKAPAYPVLDRTAFRVERACVPRFYPSFCAETAPLMAMLEAAQQKSTPQEPNKH